ncbi:MAG: hypothetical protein ACXAE3_03145 [Candidatus Kariarchaeaceae archaeon]|jgi:hypothetical protein
MRIIPYTQLLVVFLLLSIFTGVALWPDSQPTQEPIDTGRDNGDDTEGKVGVLDDFDSSPEKAEATNKLLALYPVDMLVLYMIAYLSLLAVIGWAFRSYLNLPSVQRMVNTSLELAGFSTRVGRSGRYWTVDNRFILELTAGSPQFRIVLPETEKDPLMYGFRKGETISVSCSATQIQLTLQSVRAYLN